MSMTCMASVMMSMLVNEMTLYAEHGMLPGDNVGRLPPPASCRIACCHHLLAPLHLYSDPSGLLTLNAFVRSTAASCKCKAPCDDCVGLTAMNCA